MAGFRLCGVLNALAPPPLTRIVRRLCHCSISPTTDAYTGCSLLTHCADSGSGARGRASSYSTRECCPVFSLCFYLGVVCASRFVLAGDSSRRRHDGLDGHHNGCHLGDTAMVCPVSLAASALLGLSAAASDTGQFYRDASLAVLSWRGWLVALPSCS